MKLTLQVEKQIEVKTLAVKAGVRYWEDADINGIPDEDGELIPCRTRDLWCPIIDIESGVITNWEEGKIADIHFKVCDQCSWSLLDSDGSEILSIENEYVPSFLCPGGEGYGDYIIMKIDSSGKIEDWTIASSSLESFAND